MSSKAHNVANLISSLGGPSLNLGNIAWANDLEAGNLLLSWLADQLCESTVSLEKGTDEAQETREGCERRARTAIEEVALEPEEVLMFQNIEDVPQNIYTAPQEYMPPSRLNKQAELIGGEIDGVYGEIELLRARISQTKEVSHKIKHSVGSLQRALCDLDTKTRHSEERLSELSITTDTTIASTIDSAKAVLRSLVQSVTLNSQEAGLSLESSPPENDGSLDLDSAQNLLQERRNEISILVTKLQQSLNRLSQLSLQEAAKIQDLNKEATRLENAFDSLRNKNLSSKELTSLHRAKHHGREKELQEICLLLEEEVGFREQQPEGKGEALENLFSELDDSHLVNKSNMSIQEGTVIRDILRHAWALDQEAILNAHKEALEEALLSLDSSIRPLENLQVSLANVARCVQDVEYLLDALAEELGAINLDHLGDTGECATFEKDGMEMESRLKFVLNDIRPIKAPPLQMNDMLTELRSLKGILGAESSERAWADEFVQEYSRRPIHPALPRIYANSPLSTSPPFSLPRQAQELELEFKRKATDLQGLSSSLETETRETFLKVGNTKRFGAFVDQASKR